MLKQKKAVIFDLDGTLMDSMWMWTDIDIAFLAQYGHSLPPDLQKQIEGMSFTETAVYFRERFAIPESVEEIKAQWNEMAYGMYATRVKPKPGAPAFLEELGRRGIRTGIASSNSHRLIAACLEANQIRDCFDCIMTSCDVNKGKPAPDIYLEVARSLCVRPSDCLVFEDIPMGILAGKNAGMEVCAVEDGHALKQKDEIRRLADYYIRSYDEIISGTYEVLS